MGLGTTLLNIILYPLLYPLNHKINRRNEIRTGTRAPRHHKPAPLNLTSRRPITPPFPSPPSFSLRKRGKKQTYHDQAGCSLLEKLPAEVRLMIWELCLEDDVHVFWLGGHMLGLACRVGGGREGIWNSGKSHETCYTRQLPSESRKDGKSQQRGRLALALTCRRIYTETLSLLYSLPLFDFSLTWYCIQHLPSLIPPHRMHLITAVEYLWDCRRRVPLLGAKTLDHFSQVWVETWDVLAQMRGLRYLKMEIIVHAAGREEWRREEERVVKSMEGVLGRGLERFELKGLPFESIGCTVHEWTP